MTEFMADISSNNGGFNAAAYRSGSGRPLLIMVKATEGDSYVNPFYGEWVRSAHAHGLGVIHYHFARPENGNPFGQMHHFWDTVRPHFRWPGDFVSIDLETDTPANGKRWLSEAEPYLRGDSYTNPWVYTYLSYMEKARGITIHSKRIHVAAYGPNRPGDRNWRLPFGQLLAAWQFTDGLHGPLPHTMAGVPAACDVSILNPTIARGIRNQLRKGKK